MQLDYCNMSKNLLQYPERLYATILIPIVKLDTLSSIFLSWLYVAKITNVVSYESTGLTLMQLA